MRSVVWRRRSQGRRRFAIKGSSAGWWLLLVIGTVVWVVTAYMLYRHWLELNQVDLKSASDSDTEDPVSLVRTGILQLLGWGTGNIVASFMLVSLNLVKAVQTSMFVLYRVLPWTKTKYAELKARLTMFGKDNNAIASLERQNAQLSKQLGEQTTALASVTDRCNSLTKAVKDFRRKYEELSELCATLDARLKAVEPEPIIPLTREQELELEVKKLSEALKQLQAQAAPAPAAKPVATAPSPAVQAAPAAQPTPPAA